MTNRLTHAMALLGLLSGLGTLCPTPGAAAAAPDYADPMNWLCRPGGADICSRPLTSTVLSPADGAQTRKTYLPDPAAPIDCFYVYPTVSREQTANADMTEGPEEDRVALAQFARFAAKCRTYAPLYRQNTMAALRGAAQVDPGRAYGDVRAAWKAYLAHDNHGRGVVLIGHSQGAFHLVRLIAEEIDGKPAQRLLVSAILLGGNVQVETGGDVGGSFRHVPLCRGADQTGCAIAYSSFLAASPPGSDSAFGKAGGTGLRAACVNPARLLGHDVLDSELMTTPRVESLLGTTLVENPGLISGECRTVGDHTILAISIKPSGVGAATLARTFSDLSERSSGWGLHAIDVGLTLGDLVEIVGRQSAAWLRAHR
jgi:hypothetical protein